MDIEATHDMELVKSLLIIPKVWERAVEGVLDKDEYTPSFDFHRGWLLCKEGEDIVGLIYAQYDNANSLKIHPYVLEKGKGREIMYTFYKWLINTSIAKVIVSIPFCYKETYNLSKKVGFIDEGINRKSYFKEGEMFDQWNLGLTLNEVKELVECHQY